MHHHRLVLSSPFGPYQCHKVQKISGVVGNAVVWPSQVLNLSNFPLFLTLNEDTQNNKTSVELTEFWLLKVSSDILYVYVVCVHSWVMAGKININDHVIMMPSCPAFMWIIGRYHPSPINPSLQWNSLRSTVHPASPAHNQLVSKLGSTMWHQNKPNRSTHSTCNGTRHRTLQRSCIHLLARTALMAWK